MIKKIFWVLTGISLSIACTNLNDQIDFEVYETSANGNHLKKINHFSSSAKPIKIKLLPETKHQTIIGFGGSFTESSAYLLNKLSKKTGIPS